VLVSSIPEELPPIRHDTSGRVIVHTIETQPNETPLVEYDAGVIGRILRE
jgi:hypothetical protein